MSPTCCLMLYELFLDLLKWESVNCLITPINWECRGSGSTTVPATLLLPLTLWCLGLLYYYQLLFYPRPFEPLSSYSHPFVARFYPFRKDNFFSSARILISHRPHPKWPLKFIMFKPAALAGASAMIKGTVILVMCSTFVFGCVHMMPFLNAFFTVDTNCAKKTVHRRF